MNKEGKIVLTEIGKKVYGDFEIDFHIEYDYCILRIKNGTLYKGTYKSAKIASNPLELKALIDMGLVKII